jgi:hypothetical protein
MFLLGGFCFVGGMLFTSYINSGSSNKTGGSNEEKCDKTQDNGIIVRVPSYADKEMTFEALNDPKHPQYIGHLLNFGKGGAEYNL